MQLAAQLHKDGQGKVYVQFRCGSGSGGGIASMPPNISSAATAFLWAW
jgi:hypothetical protein